MVRPEIAVMTGYVPGEQPQAGKFIKLNTNENPYPPSPVVVQAIEQAARTSLIRYPDPVGSAFRRQAADLFQIAPEWVLCGNGSDDLLTILTRAFVGQGDCLRLPYPSYILYRTLAQIQGARWEEIRFQEDWSLGPDFAAATKGLRLAFLPNPNSPSGTVLPRERISELADALDCPLVVDEAYADFSGSTCIPLVAEHPNLIVSRSLSKSYALAGLRFGFLVARPEIVEQLVKVKDSYNCDALSLAGATAALADQAWLTENVARVVATRERLAAGLAALGFSVTPSQANFVWCTYPNRPVQPIFEGLKAERILVRYMNYPGWGDGLRMTVGTDQQTDALLSVLPEVLRQTT